MGNDLEESRCFVENRLRIKFRPHIKGYNFVGKWMSSVHGLLSINVNGEMHYHDSKYNSRMPSLFSVSGSRVSIKTWIEAMPRYDVSEGYEGELYEIGYVDADKYVIWNGDGSLVMEFARDI
jgi:hypothetical protein